MGSGDGDTDIIGHGTAMAGLIAGHGHGRANSDGVYGIAPASQILPIRAGTNFSTAATIAQGIHWAINHGAQIICLASGTTTGTNELASAIDDANRADVRAIGKVMF